MSYKLEHPYTDKQKADFIVLHNHNNGREIAETQTALYALEADEIMQNGVPVVNPNYEQEQAQKEAERIAMLNLTAADVERAIYKAKGIDFEDVISSLSGGEGAREGVNIDLKALKIELKANNFYRGNPYIDTVGTILGFTKEQLDKFFETNNYKYLTTVTLTINPTPADSTVTINGVEQSTVTVPYGAIEEYSVTHEGYLTQSGSIELTEDTTLEIELVEESTPTPALPEGEGVNDEGVNEGEEPTDTEPITENESNAEVEDEDSAGTGD